MLIQYSYAVLTMLPCPFWFYHRSFSALFISAVGLWSVYNGATYYSSSPSLLFTYIPLEEPVLTCVVDVFGTRFQKELEQLKKDVARWQEMPSSPRATPSDEKNQSGIVHGIEPLGVKVTTTARETAGQDGSEVKERNVTVTAVVASS